MQKRFAIAALCGFVTFLVGVPLGCGVLEFYNGRVNGDVQSGGPAALLGGMAVAGVLAVAVTAFVFWKSGRMRG